MKSTLTRLLVAAALTAALSSVAFAQSTSRGKSKEPIGKIYFAETQGESDITANGVVSPAQQAKAFDAPGAVIATKAKSRSAFIYSNGTALVMDQNTRLKVDQFTQGRFPDNASARTDPEAEPSASQSKVTLTQGTVVVCTNQLAAGSTMVYTTPLATVTIRRGRVSIETTTEETIVDLLEGDASVRGTSQDQAGQPLRPGERAVIRVSASGQTTLSILPTPAEMLPALDERAAVACNAKKTVFFDANDQADQEITPNPAVPAKLPANITVSPDRLTGGT